MRASSVVVKTHGEVPGVRCHDFSWDANVSDCDPLFATGAFGDNFDRSLATIKGRFWYAQLKKRF